jgi:hypothetical protein
MDEEEKSDERRREIQGRVRAAPGAATSFPEAFPFLLTTATPRSSGTALAGIHRLSRQQLAFVWFASSEKLPTDSTEPSLGTRISHRRPNLEHLRTSVNHVKCTSPPPAVARPPSINHSMNNRTCPSWKEPGFHLALPLPD